ncbi:MAG: hypothetical protein ACOYL8_01525 [Patescibacteria group bacterium]
MKTGNSVKDEKRKLTADEIGKLQVKTNEIVKRIEKGNVSYEDALEVMQSIIIEGKSARHLDVVSGIASIEYFKYFIDCGAAPYVPEILKLATHSWHGVIDFCSVDISLYLSSVQKSGIPSGIDLRNEINSEAVLNANVLDYLLANPKLIPKDWRNKRVFFWGTIYSANEHLYVRCLCEDGSKWTWDCRCLEQLFGPNDYAAILT